MQRAVRFSREYKEPGARGATSCVYVRDPLRNGAVFRIFWGQFFTNFAQIKRMFIPNFDQNW